MKKQGISFFIILIGVLLCACHNSKPKVNMKNKAAYEESLMAIEREYTVKLPIQTELNLSVSPHQNISPPEFHVGTSISFVAKLNLEQKIPIDPNGSITFYQNNVTICDRVKLDLSNMSATCKYTSEAPGMHIISAEYHENENIYKHSISYLIYSVQKYTSDTKLDVRNHEPEYKANSQIILVAQTLGEKGSEQLKQDGTFKFYVNGNVIAECSAVPVSIGTCTYTVADTDALLNMSVEYSGDNNFQPSVAHITLPYKDLVNIQLMSNGIVTTPIVKESNLDKTQTATLFYDENVSENGADLKFRIIPLHDKMNVADMLKKYDFKIQSVFSAQDDMLETRGLLFSHDPRYDAKCHLYSIAEGILQAECKGFRPIVSKFSLTVALIEKKVSASVYDKVVANQLIEFTVEPKNINSIELTESILPVNGCGLKGTTRQRMFDCSMKVKNFGRRININTLTPVNYQTGDLASIYWFLVRCPANKDMHADQCAWLSPVMHQWNDVLTDGQFDSNGVPMSQYVGSRLLWSGTFFENKQNKIFTFFTANRKGTEISQYTQYPYIDQSTMPKQKSMPSKNHVDVCSLTTDDPIFAKDAPYKWQMPSYPMALTLTSGPYCARGGQGYFENWKAFCNGGNKGQGFNAGTALVGFNDYYWTSSVDEKFNIAWIFNGTGSAYQQAGGGMDIDMFEDVLSVRCVSPVW